MEEPYGLGLVCKQLIVGPINGSKFLSKLILVKKGDISTLTLFMDVDKFLKTKSSYVKRNGILKSIPSLFLIALIVSAMR